LRKRMTSAYDVFVKELGGLRTGRASPNFLDPIMVEAYGSSTPLQQVGNINVPEPRLLTVQVWDSNLVKAVEKAIRDANLGVNPSADGNLIRVPLPELTQDRRQELVKLAGKYAENARVAVRGVRRDGMDQLKKMEKDKILSEDQIRRVSDEIQTLTDEFIGKIDQILAVKEKDISHI
ncbi:MAG: ribosome recycling factor, partial [Alphaproteobacteria bacterium]